MLIIHRIENICAEAEQQYLECLYEYATNSNNTFNPI